MSYLNILKLLANQYIPFLTAISISFISLLLIMGIKIERKKELLDLILQRTAEVLIISLIPIVLLTISLTNFTFAFALSLIVVIIETKRNKSPLLNEIENININISNLRKIIAGLILDLIPYGLSTIILFYFIFIIIYSIETILVNIIITIAYINFIIMLLDIGFTPGIAMINEIKKLKAKRAKIIKTNNNNG